MGFASFSEFKIKNELKVGQLDSFKQMLSLENWTHEDTHRPVIQRHKDKDLDTLYTYKHIYYIYVYTVDPQTTWV